MIDYQTIKELGLFGFIVWNLRETVELGKQLVRLEMKINNGLTTQVKELKEDIASHIDGEEQRIIGAIIRNPTARTRSTD